MKSLKIRMLEPIGMPADWVQQAIISHHASIPLDFDYCDTRNASDLQLIDFIQDADILLLTNRPLNEKVLGACTNLKYIGVAFTGIDHVAHAFCKARKIKIVPAAGYATHAVAELTLGLAIALSRQLIEAHFTTQKGGDNEAIAGHELFGKTVGIIGGGKIGLEVGRLFYQFGSTVLLYNRSPVEETGFPFVQVKSLEQIFRKSDILSLHLPLTEETRSLVNDKTIALMKDSALIINTARGPVIDAKALMEALNNGKIRGAAVDVYDHEPPIESKHPLLKAKNIITTPHIAFKTQEAVKKKAQMTIGYLNAWLEHFFNQLN